MNAIDKLAQTILESQKDKSPKPYDTEAVVTRVEGNTAYVHIAGGVDETPAKMVISAKKGDVVRIRVSGGRAYVMGNATSPPTDDSYAIKAEREALRAAQAADAASKEAQIAHEAADGAVKDAGIARESADKAVEDSARARTAAEQAVADASRAATAAESAEDSAESASASASSASASASSAESDASAARQAAQSASAAASQSAQDASTARGAAQAAQASASSAGENASRAQAASEAAQLAAMSTITSDTIHYLATPLGSGVTRATSGWTTQIQTMTATNKYLWTYHTYESAGGATTETDPVITGTFGEKGADGTSVTILGSYDTLAELQAAHPTGTRGDAYMVGGDLYVWSGSTWENVGQIQGPQGEQGVQGLKGDKGDKGDTGEKGETGATGAKGDKGDKGDTGEKGETGAKGDKGDKGEDGISPTVTTTKSGGVTTITITDADGTKTASINDGSSPTVSKTGDTVTITDSSGQSVTVKDGEDGQSIKGDSGEDAYFHVAWANSADGTTDFSTTVATNKLYMGTYTDHTQTDSQTPSKYKWVKVKGEQGVKGDKGDTGEQGVKGDTGDDGISVASVQPQYYLSTSSSSATGGSWGTTLTYVVGKYIWTRDKITYSNNTTGYSTAIYNQALTQSCKDAAEAMGLVEEQQEYFWHDSLGAHILSDTDSVTGVRYRQDLKGSQTTFNVLNTDGTEDVVAEFGANGTQIGKNGESRLLLDYHSLQMIDKEGNTYFHVSDLRDSTGVAHLTATHIGDGTTTVFGLSPLADNTNYTVTVSDSSGGSITEKTRYSVSFSSAPSDGAIITINYTSSASDLKAYTIGNRASGSNIGAYSLAAGLDVIASGYHSHAEGRGTTASGAGCHAEGLDTIATTQYAHAEGRETTASGHYSHAEGRFSVASGLGSHAEGYGDSSHNTISSGLGSHAEGWSTEASGNSAHAEGCFTTASNYTSHAEGLSTTASGYSSHTQNIGTNAGRRAQTVIGTYNVVEQGDADTKGTYVLIIGNGANTNNRSNALAVTWDGDIEMSIDDTNTDTTSPDYKLYHALSDMGWTS